MKYRHDHLVDRVDESPPIREAWIEISIGGLTPRRTASRLPSGRRGLKYLLIPPGYHTVDGRLPSGRRGLKLDGVACGVVELLSPPIREAWIEMLWVEWFAAWLEVASHPGGVD